VYWISIGLCLVTLAYFKYTNFLVASLDSLLHNHHPGFSIILPIGISFITFEIISYICDIYDPKLRPSRDLLEFALFNGSLPRLISGPIIRPAQSMPQLRFAPWLEASALIV